MQHPRGIDLLAALAAAAGAALAVEAWFAGSLFRYVLAGLVAGGALGVPALSILLLRDRARRFWRRCLFAFVPLLLLLLLAEVGLRWFGPAPPPPEVLVEDARLGHAFAPGSGSLDAWGFRNERVPERVDALFVGDSQTFGFFVDRDEAFPALFARATGRTSYQMANGGYGGVHYRELVRRGLALHPQLVVVGFYFGNDLFDAIAGAGLDGAEDLRAPGRTYARPRNPELDGMASPNWTMALLDALQAHSRLLGAAGEVVKSRLRGGAGGLDAQPGAVPFADAKVGTVLLPDYRRPAVDLGNQGIADGLRISVQCLRDIGAACREHGARCLVLAIPTKEFAYAEWQRRGGKPLAALEALRTAEQGVRDRLFAAIAADPGLQLVDLAEPCIAALAAGTPIWAGNGDGHIMREGHRAAAAAVAAAAAKH